ncbi:glycosyltransferase [Pontibacterium sp. N1Y112]|uniref:Glycosyltransferase n=2 Tax=Pontibacterium sinense TaxID=2781979 RepID=A0A8J7K5S3_9GAMM|nr:glycosyltransferase [Pontibacterium sinense]
MIPKAIHQFSIVGHPGDGITNGMLLTQRLLRHAGIKSEIYCTEVDAELADKILPFGQYEGHPEQVLLIHHGIGNNQEAELKQLSDKCFMVFHNITPASFFAENDPIQPMLTHGWQQVDSWKTWLTGAIADSRQNYDLLIEHGYSPDICQDIPLLVDLDKFNALQPRHSFRPEHEVFNLLFVGRLMPHKNQHGLIDALYHLRCMTQQDIRLTLVGNNSDREYCEKLNEQIKNLGLQHAVKMTGKVSDDALTQYYQQSDLYVSLSHHEGFGMPLIEAMSQHLPVLAFSNTDSNVADTIGTGGLILKSDDPVHCAATIAQLIANPRLRAQINTQAQTHLERYTSSTLYDQLQRFMAQFDIQLPDTHFEKSEAQTTSFRIEGPFDSSYSLASVNRNLALALSAQEPESTALYSTEGHGDFSPDQQFLDTHPNVEKLHQAGCSSAQANTTLRLLYPPRVSGMKGVNNGLGCYGWEESVLPWNYITNFNQHLQFATTMSDYVTKTMIDNGTNIPLYTTGIGADHILGAQPDPTQLPEITHGLRLLHISSCFPRKGIDCLLSAYADAFSADDDVTLIIKTFPNPHHNIEQQLSTWRSQHPQAPHITLINKDLDDSAIRALYEVASVLIAPSRGEGFGLPMAEAMLHHVPVITTGYGGQTDFCTEQTSWLIDYQFARAQSHMGQAASIWVEPDAGHLSELLKTFGTHYTDGTLSSWVSQKAEAAYHLINSRYTWSTVAEHTRQAVSQLQQAPMLEPELKFGCITTWNSKCGIATYSQMLLEPALSNAVIFANDNVEKTATDNAYVQRCWTAGQDDSLERLLKAIQDAGLSQVLIQFNFSFFSLQSLKNLLAALHAQGIQTFITLHSTADVYWGEELKTLQTLLPELEHCTRILVHSAQDLNRLKSWGLIENCTLLPHGVTRHNIQVKKPAHANPHLSGKQVIASYGFLLPHKGTQSLIHAFKKIHAQNPNSHLLLMNAEYPAPVSAEEAQACRELIDSLNLNEHVTLNTDFLEDHESLSWLSLADIIVFPYQQTQESSSAAVRWGLATGKPVICTPLSIFEDVADAVAFSDGCSPDELAECISNTLNDPATLNALNERQQDWLVQHNWTRISKRLKNLSTSLLLNNIRTG